MKQVTNNTAIVHSPLRHSDDVTFSRTVRVHHYALLQSITLASAYSIVGARQDDNRGVSCNDQLSDVILFA